MQNLFYLLGVIFFAGELIKRIRNVFKKKV